MRTFFLKSLFGLAFSMCWAVKKGFFSQSNTKPNTYFVVVFFGGLELPFRVNLPKQCNKDENKQKITKNRIKRNRFRRIGYFNGNWTNQFTLHVMTNGEICNHINAKKWTEMTKRIKRKKKFRKKNVYIYFCPLITVQVLNTFNGS